MTIKEIISALRRCMFSDTLLNLAADTIEKLESENDRQKAEIEKLQKAYECLEQHILEIQNETLRVFAERLKEYLDDFYHTEEDGLLDTAELIDNLVKEMAGEG
ncbi:MAG: hypothetical protein IJW86_09650 [Clostridia bacterium]|nr:hypothetical protein [Clostridia bacterium]